MHDTEEPEPEGPEEGQDYLAPFLPAITGTRDMTGAEAAAVYRKCVQVRAAHGGGRRVRPKRGSAVFV